VSAADAVVSTATVGDVVATPTIAFGGDVSIGTTVEVVTRITSTPS